MTMSIDTFDEEFIYMADHVIDGKNLLPATGYLFYIWKMMAMINKQQYSDMPILFENIRFLRATVLSKHKEVNLLFIIQKGITIKKIDFILILP
jgi:fatty acid synthase